MRGFYILVLTLVFLTPISLQAGQISSEGEKGRWISTDCKAPVVPSSLEKYPETMANDLNAEVATHNIFASDAELYMDCLSTEAERDARAMSKLIIDQASDMLEAMSIKVQKSADTTRKKQKVVE